ncbi:MULTISPECIES: ThuA domain-containing protein [unclassified Robiginitalea]|uniref:ThuA domain-containing protein n=1 Tax=Robiginitalea TaxID=252306 RepID=UPI00234912DA|nr:MULTISPECIES: ThuA domain-containing protein [unclassified Robiginitalea]MDC6355010.1 ThuA domain-containing protein [Robiginitalea sp. PM2]MDC6375277.1 ThuA domain-containing protein [Robiginitalea sp. SP8]
MKLIRKALPVILVLALMVSCDKERPGPPKVLVFSKTTAFRHASIPSGIAAIQQLGANNNFTVDTTENAARFTEENLSQYSAVIFLSTTGDVLDAAQEAAFERYIQAGGGYVGVHAATDTEYDWGWYGRLAGAYFQSHPAGTPEADFHIVDKGHPATEFFQDSVWHRTDEMYNFKNLNPEVNVLITIDESTYEGGENGDYHPMAWYHEYDGGRAFYTALGHTEESFSEDLFLQHLLGGIRYAIGENLELDYDQAHSQIPPEANRFSKVELVGGEFFEPTEMTILPNGDILVGQRRGEVMLYEAATGDFRQVAVLDVYHKTLNTPGVNAEEGLMGLQKDPDYANNHWVYVYYAPTGDEEKNVLSRFKYQDGNFDLESEQVILEVASDREICCHTGGSIAFGGDGLLYLSTGDNSTPFNQQDVPYVNNGFAPLNDLPGSEQFDARRSSGNTNDLRGKILRIRVNEDGSYSIPEGNLFAEGTENTRPEIYTMGHRNPYRISVDPKNGYVYWGDVGPDARGDSLQTRGPRGYDEINQAREPGNFGWPLFIADNKAYVDYDYATGESGETFDPERPINDSENNTGLRELPPAQPAMVYYHYGQSAEFPQVGSGGRNAMAGPAYYTDLYNGEGALPDYYDGKILVYDWMRGWMKSVELFEDGTFNKMVPFASDIQLNNLIDMEVGPDGRIYLLEYGTGWFTANDNSGLSYIEYNGGNRPPMLEGLEVDLTSGAAPLAIQATLSAEDLEGDPIQYVWTMSNGDSLVTDAPSLAYTFEGTGEFQLTARAMDNSGEISEGASETIYVGNTRPEVRISMEGGNESFFIPGVPVKYSVTVMDEGQEVAPDDNLYVSVDYREGMDDSSRDFGHQQASAAITGKALTQSLDCKACHKDQEASIGPSYMEVSRKYQEGRRNSNLRYLMDKIRNGGSGVWGEVAMAAHPDLSTDELNQMASYILSLADERPRPPSLPANGTIVPDPSQAANTMILTASYTDPGQNGVKPLTGVARTALTGNRISPREDMEKEGMQSMTFGGMDLVLLNAPQGWLDLGGYDLTGVNTLVLEAAWQSPPAAGSDFELRLGSADGELVGTGSLDSPSGPGAAIPVAFSKELSGRQPLFLTFKRQEAAGDDPGMMAIVGIQFR